MSQGAMAWNSLYLRGAGYEWDSNSSGSEFTKIDDNTFKKVYTAATAGDVCFRIYCDDENNRFQWGPQSTTDDEEMALGTTHNAYQNSTQKAFKFTAKANTEYTITAIYQQVSGTWRWTVRVDKKEEYEFYMDSKENTWKKDLTRPFALTDGSTQSDWEYLIDGLSTTYYDANSDTYEYRFRIFERDGKQIYPTTTATEPGITGTTTVEYSTTSSDNYFKITRVDGTAAYRVRVVRTGTAGASDPGWKVYTEPADTWYLGGAFNANKNDPAYLFTHDGENHPVLNVPGSVMANANAFRIYGYSASKNGYYCYSKENETIDVTSNQQEVQISGYSETDMTFNNVASTGVYSFMLYPHRLTGNLTYGALRTWYIGNVYLRANINGSSLDANLENSKFTPSADYSSFTYTFDASNISTDIRFRIAVDTWANAAHPNTDNMEVQVNENAVPIPNESDWYENNPSYAFKIPQSTTPYSKYNITFSIFGNTRSVKVTGVQTTTTYKATLTYASGSGDPTTKVVSTSDESPFSFTIPQAAYNGGLTFNVKVEATETNGTTSTTTTKYYSASSITNGTVLDATYNGATPTNMTYTAAAGDEPTGDITVVLNTVSSKLRLSHPSAISTSTNYYLVGDLSCFIPSDSEIPTWPDRTWGDSDQGGVNKVLRLNDEGDGFYSFEIPAVGIANGDGNNYKVQTKSKDASKSYTFVIAPEDAFSGTESDVFTGDTYSGLTLDWSKCLRPSGSIKTMNNENVDISDNTIVSTSNVDTDKWTVNMNSGSYKFYINPTTGKWKADNHPDIRVMYVAVKEEGHWRAYQYLYDYANGGAFDGEHQGTFKTDGTGVLLIHNWKKQNSTGYFYTRNHLKIFADYDGNNLYPINAPDPQKTKIIGWDVAGTYGITIDPSRGYAGNSSDDYDGQSAQSGYGDLCGSLTREKILGVEINIPEAGGKILRTYSNVVNLAIPEDYKAYVAHDFTSTVADGKQGIVNLRQIKYIPADMGVVLIGNGENVNPGIVEFPKYTGDVYENGQIQNLWTFKDSKYSTETSSNWNNFLVAVINKERVHNHIPYNSDNDDWHTYTARNFALNVFSNTKTGKSQGVVAGSENDYVGFFRLDGNIGDNKAYLQLPITNGGFGCMDYNGQLLGNQADDNTALARTGITFDDELDDEPQGDATDIKTIDSAKFTGIKNKAMAVYDLSGRQVATITQQAPTPCLPKGIYLVGGQKVVIK